MKKLSVMLMLSLLSISAFAQLKVTNNGQVQIGNTSLYVNGATPLALDGDIGIAYPINPVDTLASLYIGGNKTGQTGGRITFGLNADVSISESSISNYKKLGALLLQGSGGITMNCGTKKIFVYDPTVKVQGVTGVASFSTPVSAPQYLTVSDSRSKTDIEPLDSLGLLLNELSPVSYVLVGNEADETETPENAPMRSVSADNGGHVQYGFLAQDVREVYPELVYEDSEGNLSLDYTGFIPILVDAVKSLQRKVDEQSRVIESLTNRTVENPSNPNPASLSQNRPNPFRATTEIDCVVPESVGNAFICIYDLNGNQKRRYDFTERGDVKITVEGSSLPAGMYIYTLVADGSEVDSKRMILTD